MRRLIMLLLILVASIWLGIGLMRHPGTVTVLAQPWMMEMPLWFAAVIAVVVLSLFYFLISCIDWLQFTWFRIKNWMRFRREQRLFNQTQYGLTLLIEARWKKAERLLLQGIHESVDPLMNYLGAAKAAQALGAPERREEYLKKARQIAPHAALAIGLTQAELQFGAEQFDQAAQTLNHLKEKAPRHPAVLALLEKVYVRTAQWQKLLTLLPSMRKARLLTADQYAQFEKNVYCEILHHATTCHLAEVQQRWHDMPRYIRKNPDVVCAYVKQLQRFTDNSEAEELIRKTLKYQWQPELAAIYGTLPLTNLNRQLVIVGAWLNRYGEHPALLLTLARLCTKVQLYGKAREYFERCLAQGPNPEASLAYGHLLEELNRPGEALVAYRNAVQNG